MKKVIFLAAAMMMFMGTVLWANPALNKAHKDTALKDGTKVNCAYCHVKNPVKKEKSADEKLKKEKLDKMKTTESYCAIKGCH